MRYKEYKEGGNIDPNYYARLSEIESGNNSQAKSRTSSASGKYQFIKSTWEELVKKYNLPYSLEDRFNSVKSKKVAELYTQDNAKYLESKLGVTPTNTDLYAAHFMGVGGASKFLATLANNPNVSAYDIASPAQIDANKPIFLKSNGKIKTAQEVYNTLKDKINNTASSPEENFQSKEQDNGYKFVNLSPLDYNQEQRLSNLETAQENTKFAEQEAVDKAQEIKNRLEEKRLYKEQYLALVNQAQVQYVQPVQSTPPPSEGENYFQTGGTYYDLPMNNGIILTPKQFTLDYINSPKYKERLINSGYKSPDKVVKERATQVETSKMIEQQGRPTVLQQLKYKIKGLPYTMSGSRYDDYTNTVLMNSSVDNEHKEFGNIQPSEIKTHETAHAEHTGSPLNINDQNQLFDRQKKYQLDDSFTKEERERIKTKGREDGHYTNVHHDLRPDENKADLNALRYLLKKEGVYDAGKEDFTKKHLDKVKSSFTKTRLLKNYKEQDLIWLMNNVADNSENNDFYGQNGGNIPISSQGVYEVGAQEVLVPTSSGKITMSGIDYPILGTDEYGNQQMMMPGQEYQFQGKLIHEIPQTKKQNKRFK